MPYRVQPLAEAMLASRRSSIEIGRELRIARATSGKRLRDVARMMGISVSYASRIERGLSAAVPISTLYRYAACVGLKVWIRAFPGGRRLLDGPQLALFTRLRARSHERIRWQTEVPMPVAGDLRAADAMALIGDCSIVFELYTRLVDVRAQTRAAHLKKRDLAATRLVLVVAATGANRRAIREAGPTLSDSFPMGTRVVLQALAHGEDPGGDGIVML